MNLFVLNPTQPTQANTLYIAVSLIMIVTKRQSEFLAGRYTAKMAMKKAGFYDKKVPTVVIGENRNPVWPDKIKGSISHSGNKAVCAIIPYADTHYIGIDLEHFTSNNIYEELNELVLSKSEIELVSSVLLPTNIAFTLIFSAKESLFKALFPFINEYFGFECASIYKIDLENNLLHINFKHASVENLSLKKKYICHFDIFHDAVLTTIHGSH
jgi:enterobactin synthetase component D